VGDHASGNLAGEQFPELFQGKVAVAVSQGFEPERVDTESIAVFEDGSKRQANPAIPATGFCFEVVNYSQHSKWASTMDLHAARCSRLESVQFGHQTDRVPFRISYRGIGTQHQVGVLLQRHGLHCVGRRLSRCLGQLDHSITFAPRRQ
jgi:hypothetical protein